MLNNFAAAVQNFVRKLRKLTENHCRIFIPKTAISGISCVILAVNILRHNDVIINKNYGLTKDKILIKASTKVEESRWGKETNCWLTKPGLSYHVKLMPQAQWRGRKTAGQSVW